ncbi:MAG TPA: hypothetical protein VIL32_03660 [Steroidobacteraceae bacterium]
MRSFETDFQTMQNSKRSVTSAVVASAVAFACLVQSLRSEQHWLVVTGLVASTVAIVLAIRSFGRES